MDNTSTNTLSEGQKGVSNTTIAVLIILALVMTIIGTLAVISQDGTNSITTSTSTTNIGRVSLQVLPNNITINQETTPVVINDIEQ